MVWNDQPAQISNINNFNIRDSNIINSYKTMMVKQTMLEVSETAHDKGVLIKSAQDGTGFYLLHSVPKYPNIDRTTASINPITPSGSSYG